MVPPSRSRAHRPKLMSLAAIIMLALLGLQAPVSAQSEDLGARALQLVADREGIAIDDLAIAEASESNLSNTGVDLADFKVQASDGRTFGVSFDATTQEVVDAEAAVAAEQQARTEALGAVDPGLADQLQQAAAERIPVAIWTVMDDPGAIGRTGNGLDELAADKRNLDQQGYDIEDIPLVLQYNKRDLPNAVPVNELRTALNKYNSTDFEGTASEGKGVFEALRTVSKSIINVLKGGDL